MKKDIEMSRVARAPSVDGIGAVFFLLYENMSVLGGRFKTTILNTFEEVINFNGRYYKTIKRKKKPKANYCRDK